MLLRILFEMFDEHFTLIEDELKVDLQPRRGLSDCFVDFFIISISNVIITIIIVIIEIVTIVIIRSTII